MADTSQSQLAYVAESTYGTTPATPVFKKLRFLSEGLKPSVEYKSSNEIRSDRNVPDLTQVGGEAAGPIGFEMSYGSFDDFLEALLGGTWTTNVLKNGTTERSFTLEKKEKNAGVDYYQRYVGARINEMSLQLSAKDIVTGSFGVMAKGGASGSAIISGATYTDPNTNPVMNASTGFQSLAMAGITSPELMSLDINISNNMYQQPVMGSLGSRGIGAGQFSVTGTFDAYFANNQMLDNYLNNIATTLNFAIGGLSSLKYLFEMNAVKFNDVEIINPGNNQAVMARVGYQAYYNGTDAASMKITRTP